MLVMTYQTMWNSLSILHLLTKSAKVDLNLILFNMFSFDPIIIYIVLNF